MFSSYFLVLKPGDGSWGTWTPYKNCPNGSLASAFRLRIQDYQGKETRDIFLGGINDKDI